MMMMIMMMMMIIIFSVNELLKIKDELTKDRDEKFSEITKVRNFLSLFCYVHVKKKKKSNNFTTSFSL